MNCPLCHVALKITRYRHADLRYCPLCGGTWLDRAEFAGIAYSPRPRCSHHGGRRLLRIALLTALILTGCLIATISVGAVISWPRLRSWAGAFLGSDPGSPTVEVSQLSGRLPDPLIARLSEAGLDGTVAASLRRHAGFGRLLSSIDALPDLVPFVRDGDYLKVLNEGARQKVRSIVDIDAKAIASPETKAAAERIQQAIARAPGGRAAARVDPAVIDLLGTGMFLQLRRSGFFDPVPADAEP